MLSHLSFATFERAPYFADRALIAIVRTQFLRAALEAHSEILAYGFAHDGALLLMESGQIEVSSFIRTSRLYSARAFRIRTGRLLWDLHTLESLDEDVQRACAGASDILSMPISGSFAWDRLNAVAAPGPVVRSPPFQSN